MKGVKGFQRGNSGRPPGALGKFSRSVREVVLATFTELQDDEANCLLAWAKREPTEFYKIAAKLIPTEIQGNVKKFVVKITDGEDSENDEPSFEDTTATVIDE